MYGSRKMERDFVGNPIFPQPVPDDPQHLLELMDDALNHAGTAQGAGAPAFDHGMRVFAQLKAHYDMRISKELAKAHGGLTSATRALKVATWWLAAVTVALGVVEAIKGLWAH